MNDDTIQQWTDDVQAFLTYWQQEVVIIKARKLGVVECAEISDHFRNHMNQLLIRRPSGTMHVDVLGEFELLINKLDNSLARALCSSESVEIY